MLRVRPRRLACLTWLLAAAGASAGAIGGCRRTAPPPVAATVPARAPLGIGAVTLRDLSASGVLSEPLALAGLQDRLRGRLAQSGLFAAPTDDAGSPSALVRVRGDIAVDGAEVEDKGVARASVRLWLDTRPSDAPGAIEETLAAEGEQIYPIRRSPGAKRDHPGSGGLPEAEKRALFAKLVDRVAVDLVDGFLAREKLRTAPEPAIHAALRADGGDLQEAAIRVAGERQLREEVPALLELLENSSEAVRDAALGALIQIGDRRAVTALTKSRSMRDRREMRKILDAIALLGGDEALDYLSFVAASHDDEEIRGLAAAAKARLERRRRDAGASAVK